LIDLYSFLWDFFAKKKKKKKKKRFYININNGNRRGNFFGTIDVTAVYLELMLPILKHTQKRRISKAINGLVNDWFHLFDLFIF